MLARSAGHATDPAPRRWARMLRTTTGLALTLTLMTDVALATPLPPPRELVSSEGAPLAPAEVLRREHEVTLAVGTGLLRCDGSAPG